MTGIQVSLLFGVLGGLLYLQFAALGVLRQILSELRRR